MKYHIVVSSDVHNKLVELAEQMEARKTGAAQKFIDAYEEAISMLTLFPFAQRVQQEGWRVIPLDPYAYIVVYRIGNDTVYVSRLIHMKASSRKKFRKS